MKIYRLDYSKSRRYLLVKYNSEWLIIQMEAKEVKEVKKQMSIAEALAELRKGKKRKFNQTVELIINLQKIDVRKASINTFIQIPNVSERKICGFFTRKVPGVDSITELEFEKYKDVKEIKRLEKKYDAFMASASLMAKVATKFGRVLGPVGKMPSPQAGIVVKDDDDSVKVMLEKMKKSLRVRLKEKSVKLAVGKEDYEDKKLIDNIKSVVNSIKGLMPEGNNNIKNVMIKFTMTAPLEVAVE